MEKVQAAAKIIKPTQVEIAKVENSRNGVIENGFCEAIGFGQNANVFGGGNIPIGGGGSGWGGFTGQTIEDTGTLYSNLRWYLVSNFRQVLSQSFVEIGLIQTICTLPVADGLRGGILIKSKQIDEDQIKELQINIDRSADLQTAGWACTWEFLYGGAGIMVLVDDQDPEEPLDIKSIGPNTNVEFRDVDMWELFWDKQNTEGYDPAIQAETFEYYNYYSENVHKTRVMTLKGIKAPSFIRPRLRGWGVSKVEALIRSINQYLKATDLGFEVLDEFKLDVYKIKNLVNTLVSPNGTQKIQQRVQMANWQKNYQNAIVMDSEDEFDHKQLSFAGLAEAMDGIRMQVASDMRIPIIKLFGQSMSTGGLGTSATEEMENYNSMVEAEVRGKLKFHILTMLEIKCQKLFGFIPDDLTIEFKPLREMPPDVQETVKTAKFDRLVQAKQVGLISDLEFRDACNKGELFDVSLDTTEDALNAASEDSKEIGDENEPGANREDSESPNLQDEHVKASEKKSKDKVKNSPGFDKASYEADGGDAWTSPTRIKAWMSFDRITQDPLFQRAVDDSKEAFGRMNPAFCMWYFKKMGGKL